MGTANIEDIKTAMAELEEELVLEGVDRCIKDGIPPLEIIDELGEGIETVGQRFKEGEYYLSELVFSGNVFKDAMDKVRPLIKTGDMKSSNGKVVIGTVKGDIHDLGKNIVITLLECSGYDVIDLGVDVPADDFVKAIKESGAKLVGLSALLSTACDSMEDTIKAIRKAGFGDINIMIGGAATNIKIKERVGADFYGPDATEAVDIAKQLLNHS